jgi:hypothetical protein
MAPAPHRHHDVDSNAFDLAILTEGRYDHQGRRESTSIRTQDFEISITPPPPTDSTRQSLMKRLPGPRLVISSLPLLVAIALLVLLLAKASDLTKR